MTDPSLMSGPACRCGPRAGTAAIAIFAAGLAAACMTPPRSYEGRPPHDEVAEQLIAPRDQVETGVPIGPIDWIGSWIFGLPGKLILIQIGGAVIGHGVAAYTSRHLEPDAYDQVARLLR